MAESKALRGHSLKLFQRFNPPPSPLNRGNKDKLKRKLIEGKPLEIEDITSWLSKRSLMYSIDNRSEELTTIIIKVRKTIEFKTYKLTIDNIKREIELRDVSSSDTSFRSQFLTMARFSYYKDVLKRLEQEINSGGNQKI